MNINKYTAKSKFKRLLISHIENHLKEYFIIMVLFIVGILTSIFYVNNLSDVQVSNITEYINSFINNIKQGLEINDLILLKTSIIKNTLITIALLFAGTTVIGGFLIYAIIVIVGFSFGYVISSMILVLGVGNGILFSIISILLQSIVLIPTVFLLSIHGLQFQSDIKNDKKNINIKLKLIEFLIISLLLFSLMILASFIETYVSKNLIIMLINYF